MDAITMLSKWKTPLRTGLFISATLVVYASFPVEDRLSPTIQSLVLGIAFFLVLPTLFTRFVSREPLSVIGFGGSVRRYGAFAVPLVALSILSVWYAMVRTFPVVDTYHLPVTVRNSFPYFLVYEIFLVGLVTLLYEVFFRGLILLSWLRNAGWWAVAIQSVILILFIAASNGGVSWQNAPLLLASVGAGSVAFYTRSVPYAWATSWLILFLSDVIILVS